MTYYAQALSASAAPKKRTFHSAFLWPWYLYVVFSSVYLMPNGTPQIADYIFLVTMVPIVIKNFMGQRGPLKDYMLVGILFVIYAFIINLINYLFLPDIRFLLTCFIYIYNFVVFITIVSLLKQRTPEMLRGTYYAIIGSIILQVVWLMLFPEFGWRSDGTFNNPNQLAYWTVLTAVLLGIIRYNQKFTVFDFILLGVLFFIQSVALSKAGLITFFLYMIVIYISPLTDNLKRMVMMFFFICLMAFAIFQADAIIETIERVNNLQLVVDRLENIGEENDDSASARGYDRLINFPVYTVLGAGEGGFARFDSFHVRELHSGLATIFFSYGILGGGLFFLFIFLVLRRQKWHQIAFILILIAFGLTHQNFRFTHFWMALGLGYGLSVYAPRFKPDPELAEQPDYKF